MATDLSEVETGSIEVTFATDVEPGTEFRLREAKVYEADEIENEVPKYGKWIPVHIYGQDGFLQAVSGLIQELQRYENPLAGPFHVESWSKSGTKDHSPYEVELEPGFDPSQAGLE